MSGTRDRRSSISSSTASMGKRHSMENLSKVTPVPPQLAKKRSALSNLTNQKSVARNSASKTMVPCTTKIAKVKKAYPSSINSAGISVTTLSVPLNVRPPSFAVPCKATSFSASDETLSRNTVPLASCSSMDVSPSNSDGLSVSLDETTSTFDSLKSPQVEYIDNDDSLALRSIERKTSNSLCISEKMESEGSICKRELLPNMDTTDEVINVDDNEDPQLCKTFICDIYNHLRESEMKKRPSIDFMEKVQKDINPSMRAILVDWLVEVSEEYRLVPETLYLTVNYIDRYLSGNAMDRQRLQLLGVACMMIASKYEEICAPQVEEFCYITDNTYFKEEVLQMESSVLNYLKFEMTAPTIKCFLRRFVRAAAQGTNEVPLLHLECMASYLAELSLVEYPMLCYAPSLIAASAIFLAVYILIPSKKPWNPTLAHYTRYQPSDLRDCVEALHRLCYGNINTNLPAIREKYSQHKYKFVAKKYCPPSIPPEFFRTSRVFP